MEQHDFCTLLNYYLLQRFHRTWGGAQLIANAVNQRFEKISIQRTTIRNWLQGMVTNPQLWWQVSAVASVVWPADCRSRSASTIGWPYDYQGQTLQWCSDE